MWELTAQPLPFQDSRLKLAVSKQAAEQIIYRGILQSRRSTHGFPSQTGLPGIWVRTDFLKGVKGNKGWPKLKTKLRDHWMIDRTFSQPESSLDLVAIKQELRLLSKYTCKNRQSASTGNPSGIRNISGESLLFLVLFHRPHL